jgi:hypothetical protein
MNTLDNFFRRLNTHRKHSFGALCQSEPLPKSSITRVLLSEFEEVLESWIW